MSVEFRVLLLMAKTVNLFLLFILISTKNEAEKNEKVDDVNRNET